MRIHKYIWIISLLSIFVLILAGCGPRATSGTAAEIAGDSDLVLDFPAIVIDVDSDGQFSVGNSSLANIGGLLGQDLSSIQIDPETIAQMSEGNIQHVQIDNSPDGIRILVNGQPIPSFVWDGDTLATTAETLQHFDVDIPLLDKLLPLVRTLGVAAVIRFPVIEEAEPIPAVVDTAELAAESKAAQEEFLDTVGTPPVIQLEVDYAADGTWSAGDLNSETLSAAGIDVPDIPAETLTQLAASGVESIGISTDKKGVFIAINGNQLPYLSWENGEVRHFLNVAGKMGLLGAIGDDPNFAFALDAINQLLPAIQASDVDVVINIPQATE